MKWASVEFIGIAAVLVTILGLIISGQSRTEDKLDGIAGQISTLAERIVVVENEIKSLDEHLEKVDGLMADSGRRLRRLELVQTALGEEGLTPCCHVRMRLTSMLGKALA